jgi:transcriptional regulator with XRE-family HTH domain
VYGRAFKPFSTETVEVTSADVDQWSFKKIVTWKRREFAIFSNAKGEEIMQSRQAIRYIRLRPGEENYNSKLSNAQGLELFRRANEGESRKDLAAEFGVSERYVSDIKNIRTRVRITLDYLNGAEKTEPAKATVASRNKNKKLSPALAKFIRSDNKVQRMNVKELAKKYCVSDRTIQRILKGDMYPEK